MIFLLKKDVLKVDSYNNQQQYSMKPGDVRKQELRRSRITSNVWPLSSLLLTREADSLKRKMLPG